MNVITSFIDNMFANLPKTPDILKVKEDLHQTMMDKYNEYKREGKSEHEAIGQVISEFGNMDELLEELGVQSEEKDLVPVKEINAEDAKKLLNIHAKHSRLIALGVFLCIMAVGLAGASEGLLSLMNRDFGPRVINLVRALLFFIPILPAVAVFIYSGMELDRRTRVLSGVYKISLNAKKEVELLHDEHHSKYVFNIIVGVLLCISAVLIYIVGSGLSQANKEFFRLAFFFIVAFAVYRFITVGNHQGMLSKLMHSSTRVTKKMKRTNKTVAIVSAIIWPITTVFFFIWGFFWPGGFGRSWILFVIVGITYGAFEAVMETLNKDE